MVCTFLSSDVSDKKQFQKKDTDRSMTFSGKMLQDISSPCSRVVEFFLNVMRENSELCMDFLRLVCIGSKKLIHSQDTKLTPLSSFKRSVKRQSMSILDESEVFDDEDFMNSEAFRYSMLNSSNKSIRSGALMLVGKILDNLDEKSSVWDDSDCIELLETIRTCLLSCTNDRIITVRVHAVISLKRLQDSDPDADDQVYHRILWLMTCDPSFEVRLASISSIEISEETLSFLVTRIQDVNSNVREMVLDVVTEKVSIKALPISDRVKILREGLYDESDEIQKKTYCLFWKWFENCGKKISHFVHLLDVEQYFLDLRKIFVKFDQLQEKLGFFTYEYEKCVLEQLSVVNILTKEECPLEMLLAAELFCEIFFQKQQFEHLDRFIPEATFLIDLLESETLHESLLKPLLSICRFTDSHDVAGVRRIVAFVKLMLKHYSSTESEVPEFFLPQVVQLCIFFKCFEYLVEIEQYIIDLLKTEVEFEVFILEILIHFTYEVLKQLEDKEIRSLWFEFKRYLPLVKILQCLAYDSSELRAISLKFITLMAILETNQEVCKSLLPILLEILKHDCGYLQDISLLCIFDLAIVFDIFQEEFSEAYSREIYHELLNHMHEKITLEGFSKLLFHGCLDDESSALTLKHIFMNVIQRKEDVNFESFILTFFITLLRNDPSKILGYFQNFLPSLLIEFRKSPGYLGMIKELWQFTIHSLEKSEIMSDASCKGIFLNAVASFACFCIADESSHDEIWKLILGWFPFTAVHDCTIPVILKLLYRYADISLQIRRKIESIISIVAENYSVLDSDTDEFVDKIKEIRKEIVEKLGYSKGNKFVTPKRRKCSDTMMNNTRMSHSIQRKGKKNQGSRLQQPQALFDSETDIIDSSFSSKHSEIGTYESSRSATSCDK